MNYPELSHFTRHEWVSAMNRIQQIRVYEFMNGVFGLGLIKLYYSQSLMAPPSLGPQCFEIGLFAGLRCPKVGMTGMALVCLSWVFPQNRYQTLKPVTISY